MNDRTIAQILFVLGAAYPRFELTPETVQIYEETLSDIPVDALHAATLDMVAESKFFPTVAEIRKSAFKLMGESDGTPSAYEAWELTMRFVRQGRGHPLAIARSEWDDIHPLIEQTVRQVGGWAHLGQAENATADRARFIEAYDRMIEKREYLTRQLPQIADLAQRLSITQPEEDPANGQQSVSVQAALPVAARVTSTPRARKAAHSSAPIDV